ncbi:MAG: methyl-accepting chemotaxis protein [Thauera sp.]|jgi:twitching motility protein PilJ|nr:methyl-accepting chemotaxis protein [Thauera sp.]
MAIPFFRRKKTDDSNATIIDTASPRPAAAASGNQRSAAGQTGIRMYGVLFGALALLTAAMLVYHQRNTANATLQIAATSEMQMLSQQIAKAAQLAVRGDNAAFGELNRGRERFTTLVETLQNGGAIDLGELPPVDTALQPLVEEVTLAWQDTARNAAQLLAQRQSLLALNKAANLIATDSEVLLEQAQQIDRQLQPDSSDTTASRAISRSMMLSQRLAKNANALLAAEVIDPETAFALGRDTDELGKQLELLGRAGASEPELRAPINALTKASAPTFSAAQDILGGIQQTVQAKQAGQRISADTQALLGSTTTLTKGLSAQYGRFGLIHALIALSGLGSALALLAMARSYQADTAKRRAESDQQRELAEHERNLTQQAILRLMNEMGDLADGDLTVRATVTEDITGAIADSVNYTVEELSVLVSRINDAAGRVNIATESAQRTSRELLVATQRQSQEIETAGSTVQGMAQSMSDASAQALQSAQVARRSLQTARKGAEAVQDSIRGMNSIRGQIQETSKRIKRLGESSQEIGEIVELISDITEQTNVLALNAAIQAASAGEAGRGFTVVAEEVQRLAERSAEATKQIAAIVKTIQTDTHDAVAAMENATRDVVTGAQLSDAAGQALSEIDAVSLETARLIEQISINTQSQAATASKVAAAMKEILGVTEQTSLGTQQTAVSIGQLADLAVELKGSVSGFKV